MSKKTVILGASNNTNRYAFAAAERLKRYGHPFVPVGVKRGEVLGHPILDIFERPLINEVDTITLYIGPRHQEGLDDYIIKLNPKRVIFNPGTENEALSIALQNHGIQTIEACTLVMLSVGNY